MHNQSFSSEHRILIIDDNKDIHNDFDEILAPKSFVDAADVDALDAELFGDENTTTPKKSQKVKFLLDHALQGELGFEKVKRGLEEAQPYSVAFVDMRMPPGWDGLETIERIWKIDPYIQVVICTAYADYELDEITQRLGISDNLFFLRKPFDSVEVAQLANALTVKWELTKIMEYNMYQMERSLEEQKKAQEIGKTEPPPEK